MQGTDYVTRAELKCISAVQFPAIQRSEKGPDGRNGSRQDDQICLDEQPTVISDRRDCWVNIGGCEDTGLYCFYNCGNHST